MKLMINSKLDIRKGYDKFLTEALNYFDLDTLEYNVIDNYNIVNEFINASNSKCHISYWILRHTKSITEAKKLAKSNSQKFINSSYKLTNRSLVSSTHCKTNHARGHTGYTIIGDLKCYCRSKDEFVLWHLLAQKYGIENIKYEYETFNINDTYSYKPDFFIYDDDKLIKIIECKSSTFKQNARYDQISNFFKLMNINYEIIINPSKKINNSIKNKLHDWISSDRVRTRNVGANNPRWGVSCTDKTKKLISQKAIERFKSKIYKDRITKAVINKVGVKIKQVSTNDVYDSISTAAKELNISYHSMHRMIKTGDFIRI